MVALGKKGNRKGSVLDLLLIIGFILVFSVVILIGYVIMSNINHKIQDAVDIPLEAKQASETLTNYYPTVIDNSSMLLVVFTSIGAIIMASMVRIHPIFIPAFIIVWFVLIFISGVASNIYQSMASDTTLSTYANQLTVTSRIMDGLPLIIAVVGIIIMIVMYKGYKDAQSI